MPKLYLLLLAATLLSCSTSPTEPPGAATKPAAGKLVATRPANAATGPELAVKDYLSWYAGHHEEFDTNFILGAARIRPRFMRLIRHLPTTG